MLFEKFLFGRCPNCGKHGISVFDKWGTRRKAHVQCIHCESKYSVSRTYCVTTCLSVALGLGALDSLLNTYVCEIPGWVSLPVILGAVYLLAYIAPLDSE